MPFFLRYMLNLLQPAALRGQPDGALLAVVTLGLEVLEWVHRMDLMQPVRGECDSLLEVLEGRSKCHV